MFAQARQWCSRAAASALVVRPAGSIRPFLPFIRPLPTAQRTASTAQPETLAASAKADSEALAVVYRPL